MHSVPRLEEHGSIYLNDWAEEPYAYTVGREALLLDFEIDAAELEGVEILLASYDYHEYAGEAFVLFRRAGRLYEVNASHCSCFELEGMWRPEETTVEALRYRVEQGELGKGEWQNFADDLLAILHRLEAL